MKDKDIRKLLKKQIYAQYKNENDTIIIEEFGLHQGDSRIDVAVANGSLLGYEIKSDYDTLSRLPQQIEMYSKILDHIVLLVGEKLLNHAQEIIPDYWGIITISGETLVELKIPEKNKNIDPYYLSTILWKNEALNLLKFYNLSTGMANKNRVAIWKKISENIPLNNISQYVLSSLKMRTNWRVEIL